MRPLRGEYKTEKDKTKGSRDEKEPPRRKEHEDDEFQTLSVEIRAVFVRFSLGEGQSFDRPLATIAGMEVAKLVLWNSLLN